MTLHSDGASAPKLELRRSSTLTFGYGNMGMMLNLSMSNVETEPAQNLHEQLRWLFGPDWKRNDQASMLN